MRRSLLELVAAVIGSALIGFGLGQALAGLGWSTAIGLGLVLVAIAYFVLGSVEIIKSPYTKYVLVAVGVVLILLPAFERV